ncbi:TadE/TadG family type IV pilus assembly protein [Acidocella sp.]|uniref:TadE/TadG family type IV pilus assembly protein n=1 Tax=Acidocella sp. TaxID=50710 RepID=UPI0026268160|nr:TadE/TadG family type IV pilus assembly protein [Acidocella sp.]
MKGRSLRLIVRRFCHERRAVTALEFAMIGMAFFTLVFGILLVSLDLFWQLTLDDAVRNAVRQVQIGKITTGPEFSAAICAEFGAAVPNCRANLQYAVQGGQFFGTGANSVAPVTFDGSGNLGSQALFSGITASSPASETVVLAQVAFPVPITLLMLPNGAVTENGTPSLYAVVSTVMAP